MKKLRILAPASLAAVAVLAGVSALAPAGESLAQTPAGTTTATATATASPTGTGTATTTSTATGTGTTPTPIPTSFANAAATRDSLLAIARTLASAGLDATKPGEGMGIYAAWKGAYPQLTISGSAVTPNGSNVSAYSNLLSSKDLASPTNPYVLAFTVRDVTGACAAGVAIGFPVYSKFEAVTLPNTANCTAQEVVAAVSASAKPTTPTGNTTSSTTVPGAPRPPATGNSAGSEGGASALLLALAGVALSVGGAVATVMRRHC